MNIEEMEKTAFLEALKKELGDRYNKAMEDEYLEAQQAYAGRPAQIGIVQIANKYRYYYSGEGVFLNAIDAPVGRRGGEGFQAFFVTEDGILLGFVWGAGPCTLETGHKYNLVGRDMPGRAGIRLTNMEDLGEVDNLEEMLLNVAAKSIDELHIPPEVVDSAGRGYVPVAFVAKTLPFVRPEPQWDENEPPAPGRRPIGDQPFVQDGQVVCMVNATDGRSTVRLHIRKNKSGQSPVSILVTEGDLEKIAQSETEAPIKLGELLGNQGGIFVGNLFKETPVSQPDGTQVVYREIQLGYMYPYAKAAEEIDITKVLRRAPGMTAEAKIDNEILTTIAAYSDGIDRETLNMLEHEPDVIDASLERLVSQGKVVLEDGKYKATEQE